MKKKDMQGKSYAGNPHVRFDEGAGASIHSGRSALLYVQKRIRLFIVAVGVCPLFQTVQAEDFAMKAGAKDFADVASYTNAAGATPTALPASGDTIFLAEGETYELQQGTDSFATFSSVRLVKTASDNVITMTASADATISAAIRSPQRYPAARIVKKGPGKLSFVASGVVMTTEDTSYRCDWDIEAGAVDFMPSSNDATTRVVGSIKIWEGATLLLPPGKTKALGLTGSGLVTNANETVAMLEVLCRYKDDHRQRIDFAGVFGGALSLTANGPGRLSGTASTATEPFLVSGINYGGTSDGYGADAVFVEIDKFGNAGDSSSIGSADTLIMGYYGGHVRYRGTGETTDKKIVVQMSHPDHNSVFIDGGPMGGLVLNGASIMPEYANGGLLHMCLELKGSNVNECVVACPVNPYVSKGVSYPFHVKKSGVGAWCLRGNAAQSQNTGAYTVEEGTLKFDALAPVGKICDFGTSQDLCEYEPFNWSVNATKRIPYAFILGKAEGGLARFEYDGTAHAINTGRRIGLAGDACIASTGAGELFIDGVSAIGEGAVRTLTLESVEGSLYNEASNITNGEGMVSVVKTGAGRWTLADGAAFTGALIVSNGTLAVRGQRPYTWFRFTFKESWAGWPNFHEIALYGTDGARKNVGLVYERTAPVQTGSNFTATPTEAPYALARNHVTYQNPGMNKWANAERDLQVAFDDLKGQPWVLMAHNNGKSKPVADDESTWIPIVMRLDESAGPIMAYDFVCGNQNNIFKTWSVEGSVDGTTWHSLTNATYGETQPTLATGNWYSAPGTAFAAGRKVQTGEGFPLPMLHTPDVMPLSGVSDVFVAPGATLTTEDAITLNCISVDPFGEQDCLIEGFTFAAEGTLTLTTPPSGDRRLPVSFVRVTGLNNLRNWSVVFGGRPHGSYRIIVEGDRVRVATRGIVVNFR